jgi:hypothetical protein
MTTVDANHRVAQVARTSRTRSGGVISVKTPLPAATAHVRTPAGAMLIGKAPDLADWLGLAAAPTFAIMALLTGILGGSSADMLCSAMQASSPWCGMVAMYVLMSAFHSAPWIRKLGRMG